MQLRSETDYDIISSYSLQLGGNLDVTLADGFVPSSSDVFPIIQTDTYSPLTGSFLNIGPDGTLETADGLGYFQTEYIDVPIPGNPYFGIEEFVLTDFQPGTAPVVPEPASAGILLTSSLGLLKRRRRCQLNH
jgi:hypothetical protein